ncbi:MAG TPA: 4-hydroxy-tetrahydrodipicolinate reductase [Flavobacteriaceae bacterium]|nr:4-hydroxy-tetrahydrodipicolinate reductase [Flavobacteriaceae bacterium]
MKIAILGYGQMGKTIEKLALESGDEIVYKTSQKIDPTALKKAEVAIDFSIAEAAFENISTCLKNGIPVVSGTTGWLEDYQKAVELCKKLNGSFLYASNFSVGVNLFFELNRKLAKMMKNQKDYHLHIEEIHHTKKRDAPSGTAISLAEDIVKESNHKTDWQLVGDKNETLPEYSIPISAERLKDVKGTHIVEYKSDIDAIEIKHTAFSREGFAKGALLGAKFIYDKKGIFNMKEVLKNLI